MFRKVVLAFAVSVVLPASAMAQAGSPPSCDAPTPQVDPAITTASPGQQIAVQQAAEQSAVAKANAAVPAGATVLDCNVGTKVIGVPAGTPIQPSPAVAGLRAKIRDNGGNGNLGAIGCSMVGHVYYVSTPTYIHVDVLWSCTAYYSRMSGAGVVLTPSHGGFSGSYSQANNWEGGSHLEFPGVAWFGYHNRQAYEYGTFAFSVGYMYVQTDTAYI